MVIFASRPAHQRCAKHLGTNNGMKTAGRAVEIQNNQLTDSKVYLIMTKGPYIQRTAFVYGRGSR